jgi:hypothetical protein
VAYSIVVWAQRLAIAALAIIAVYHVDEVMKASGGSGFIPIINPMMRGALFEVPALVLSVVSFGFSWNKPSIIVSMVLLITGSLMVVDGITIGTRYLSIVTIPGPIIGLLYGLAVLALGMTKAIMTVAVMKTVHLAEK